MKVILLVLLSGLLLASCSSREAPPPPEEPLEEEATFRDARSLVSGPEGLYIIGKKNIFLWKDDRKINWIDLSPRA